MDQYQKLSTDLGLYAAVCLKIRPKAGALTSLEFNATQRFLHGRLDAQLEKNGKVRALVLKGRQTGVSTYVGRGSTGKSPIGKAAERILTHLQDATDNLFGIVQRFHDHCDPEVKPHTTAANAKELYFDKLNSGYLVATAGSREVGRSDTIQLFHGSEVAFWPNAESHIEGIGQAIADAPAPRAFWSRRRTELETCSTLYGRRRRRAKANTKRFSCHGICMKNTEVSHRQNGLLQGI